METGKIVVKLEADTKDAIRSIDTVSEACYEAGQELRHLRRAIGVDPYPYFLVVLVSFILGIVAARVL